LVQNSALTLKDDDPRVVAALDAEQRLFAHYGLKAKTHFVRLDRIGIKIRVTEIGAGEPVLIVPGNTGDVFPLAGFMAELRDRRIIAINRPGGGMSEGMDVRKVDLREFAVQTLTTVLDAFDLDKAPIVAHSFGGHWSLWLALDRPERVTTLTLLGVPGNVLTTCPPLALRLTSVPLVNRFLFSLIVPRGPETSLKGLAFMGHSPETCAQLPAALADCYYHFQRLPHYQISSLSFMERANRLRGARPEIRIGTEQLRTIQQPTMFLWGDNDPFGSVEAGRQIAKTMPNAAFHALSRSGHLPWLDNLSECGRLTRDFLSGDSDNDAEVEI
jgi:2-hydroxy-6-oxonona-2,4-dienedioate hydrolase